MNTFTVQPFGVQLKSSATTYLELTNEFLANSNYYFSDYPTGVRNFGKIIPSQIYLRQSSSIKSTIEESISTDPITVPIKDGHCLIQLPPTLPREFKVILRELIFSSEPEETHRTFTFTTGTSDSIPFTLVKTVGCTDHQLEYNANLINLQFDPVTSSKLTQIKIYIIPHLASIVYRQSMEESVPPEPKYASKSATCIFLGNDVTVMASFPQPIKVKEICFTGLRGELVSEGTLLTSGAYYPWINISGKQINHVIKLDTVQLNVHAKIYFEPIQYEAPLVEHKPDEEVLSRYLELSEIQLRVFKDGTYRAPVIQYQDGEYYKVLAISIPPDFKDYQGYIIYQDDNRVEKIPLKKKGDFFQINVHFSYFIFVFSKSGLLENQLFETGIDSNKFVKINTYGYTFNNIHDALEEEINTLRKEIQKYQKNGRK